MSQNDPISAWGDVTVANYTAVVSDLHLCEAEPIHPQFPLWKKYKTKAFFFDQEFKAFLELLGKKSEGQCVELILNGDIFDFDSVTSVPEAPPYRVSWLERRRGLYPQAEKSCYKLERILEDHSLWLNSLRDFVLKGHRVVFVIGNHDVELHFPQVQELLVQKFSLPAEQKKQIVFTDWFYISNQDTLIEHGNQYDPYCVVEDPIHPFVEQFNKVEVKLPFGSLTTRYLINGMGFFNPHVDTNYLMSAKEYAKFFFRYIVRVQPLLMWTWLWSSMVVLIQSSLDRMRSTIKDPLALEDKVEDIARRANATPRMVRELYQLSVAPASSQPLTIMKELWLDRALLVGLTFFIILQVFIFIRAVWSVSFFWMFIPLFLFLPFFIFYSRSVSSSVMEFKEPREQTLTLASMIAKVHRVVYGHTHLARHEIIGAVEHLNSGTWSPAFFDVECTRPIGHKTFVWIEPGGEGQRIAKLYEYSEGIARIAKALSHKSWRHA